MSRTRSAFFAVLAIILTASIWSSTVMHAPSKYLERPLNADAAKNRTSPPSSSTHSLKVEPTPRDDREQAKATPRASLDDHSEVMNTTTVGENELNATLAVEEKLQPTISNTSLPFQVVRNATNAQTIGQAFTIGTTGQSIVPKNSSKYRRKKGARIFETFPDDRMEVPQTMVDGTILPVPIFVLSLPKSGTSSIHKFFNCGKVKSSHGYARRDGATARRKVFRVGPVWARNVANGRPLLNGIKGDYRVWSDEGIPEQSERTKCFYPSFEALDNIYQYYPRATILMVVRDTETWVKSARKWRNGKLIRKWEKNCRDFPNKGSTNEDWVRFYDEHTEHVRHFAESHPSLTYVEIPLEFPATVFEEKTGVKASCWKDCNPKTGKCQSPKNNTMAIG